LRLFVSEETEVDRSDPNLPPAPPIAPSIPNQTANTAVTAPGLGTRDTPSVTTAHHESSERERPQSDEPSRNTEPPTVILPLPPPSRAFLPLAIDGIDARFVAWRSVKRVGVVVVVLLAILGAGDLVSRLEDAFASSPEPPPAAAGAIVPTPATTTSPEPVPAPIAPAPASAVAVAPVSASPAAAPAPSPPALNQRGESKLPTPASAPAREAAITPKPTQPTLTTQTSPTGKATPQNTRNRTPAAVSAATQRAAGTAEPVRAPAASATSQRTTTPATTAQRAAAPAAAPARFVGTLRVASQPAGAAVSINGRPIGVTPITLEQQRAGSLAVQIALEGFERWSAAVQVPAGRVTQVNATLRPAAR
jgi:hypothetical protein